MGLNDKVSAERVHIGFFGLRNAGKSSVVNAVTGQSLSLVSETKGTTTDPVQKAMELLPIGPVVIIDTPGIDDVGTLGEMRVKRALQVLDKTDIAILVVDAEKGLQPADQDDIDDVLLSSQEGIIIRLHANEIPVQSRYGSGVRVMRLGENDKVMVLARTDHDDEAQTESIEADTEDEPTAEQLAEMEAADEASAAEAPEADTGDEE